MALIQQTRAQIRRRVADIFGDLRQGTATTNGSTTTILDTFNVNTGTDDYRKCEILFTSSPNDGLASVVTSVTQSTGTITFTPARTSTTTGNTYELYKMQGIGFSIAEYHRAINDAIQSLHGAYLLESMQDVALPYSADNQTFIVPATLYKLFKVEYEISDGFWKEIPPARRSGGLGGWTLEPETGVGRIEGRIAQQADTYELRCWGYKLQQPLTADTDTCLYDADAVVWTAAATLCMGRLGGPVAKYGQMLLTLEKKAELARSASVLIEHPQSRTVRA